MRYLWGICLNELRLNHVVFRLDRNRKRFPVNLPMDSPFRDLVEWARDLRTSSESRGYSSKTWLKEGRLSESQRTDFSRLLDAIPDHEVPLLDNLARYRNLLHEVDDAVLFVKVYKRVV